MGCHNAVPPNIKRQEETKKLALSASGLTCLKWTTISRHPFILNDNPITFSRDTVRIISGGRHKVFMPFL